MLGKGKDILGEGDIWVISLNMGLVVHEFFYLRK